MISEKLKKITEELSNLSLVEAATLAKFLEESWGVSAAAPAAVMPGAIAAEEKDSFDVLLSETGAKKIDIIKLIRGATGLGLIEAKQIADKAAAGAETLIKAEMPTAEAQKLVDDILAAGGKAVKK